MKSKKIIILSLIICSIISITLISFYIIPNIIYKNDINKLEKEIIYINSSLKDNKVINTSDLEKNITIKNKKLEKEIEKDAINIITAITNINNISNDDKLNLSINNLENNELNNINDNFEGAKTELNTLKNTLLDFDNYKKTINSNIQKELLNKLEINNYIEKLDDLLNRINIYQQIISFLNNKEYKIENSKLIFLKRNSYDEFNTSINNIDTRSINIFSYELVNDVEAPIIDAYDMSLYQWSYIDLISKFSCIDEVDGNLECNIEGSYNQNVVGVYPIKISTEDKSGNKSEKTIYIHIIEKEKFKYYTEIIRNYNTVIVYEKDENNQYTKIAKVFPCSTGRNGATPVGVFYTKKGYAWGSLIGGVWGQYYTVITGDILFHSVPYYSMSKDNLEWEEYNKLGTSVSAGCVRLTVADAKWIYDNCPSGMQVKIYDGELPNGVSKPSAIKIDGNSPYRGWDPTDPDPANPYNNQ